MRDGCLLCVFAAWSKQSFWLWGNAVEEGCLEALVVSSDVPVMHSAMSCHSVRLMSTRPNTVPSLNATVTTPRLKSSLTLRNASHLATLG